MNIARLTNVAKGLIISIFIVNNSSAKLNNVMLVQENQVLSIGTLEIRGKKKVELPSNDSVIVVFTLKEKKEDWIGTDKLPVSRDIEITDDMNSFSVVFY